MLCQGICEAAVKGYQPRPKAAPIPLGAAYAAPSNQSEGSGWLPFSRDTFGGAGAEEQDTVEPTEFYRFEGVPWGSRGPEGCGGEEKANNGEGDLIQAKLDSSKKTHKCAKCEQAEKGSSIQAKLHTPAKQSESSDWREGGLLESLGFGRVQVDSTHSVLEKGADEVAAKATKLVSQSPREALNKGEGNELSGANSDGGLEDAVSHYLGKASGKTVNLDGVEFHTDKKANEMAGALGARAFTHGKDIYFGPGEKPGLNDLTFHEVTHAALQATPSKSSSQSFEKSVGSRTGHRTGRKGGGRSPATPSKGQKKEAVPKPVKKDAPKPQQPQSKAPEEWTQTVASPEGGADSGTSIAPGTGGVNSGGNESSPAEPTGLAPDIGKGAPKKSSEGALDSSKGTAPPSVNSEPPPPVEPGPPATQTAVAGEAQTGSVQQTQQPLPSQMAPPVGGDGAPLAGDAGTAIAQGPAQQKTSEAMSTAPVSLDRSSAGGATALPSPELDFLTGLMQIKADVDASHPKPAEPAKPDFKPLEQTPAKLAMGSETMGESLSAPVVPIATVQNVGPAPSSSGEGGVTASAVKEVGSGVKPGDGGAEKAPSVEDAGPEAGSKAGTEGGVSGVNKGKDGKEVNGAGALTAAPKSESEMPEVEPVVPAVPQETSNLEAAALERETDEGIAEVLTETPEPVQAKAEDGEEGGPPAFLKGLLSQLQGDSASKAGQLRGEGGTVSGQIQGDVQSKVTGLQTEGQNKGTQLQGDAQNKGSEIETQSQGKATEIETQAQTEGTTLGTAGQQKGQELQTESQAKGQQMQTESQAKGQQLQQDAQSKGQELQQSVEGKGTELETEAQGRLQEISTSADGKMVTLVSEVNLAQLALQAQQAQVESQTQTKGQELETEAQTQVQQLQGEAQAAQAQGQQQYQQLQADSQAKMSGLESQAAGVCDAISGTFEQLGSFAGQGVEAAQEFLGKAQAEAKKQWDSFVQSATPVMDAVGQQWNRFQEWSGPFWNGLSEKANQAANFVGEKAGQAQQWLGDQWNTLSDGASQAWDGFQSGVSGVRDWMSGQAQQAQAWVGDKVAGMQQWLGDTTGQARDWLNNKTARARDWLNNQTAQAGAWVSDKAAAAQGWISDKAASAQQTIQSLASGAQDWISEQVGQATGWISGRAGEAQAWLQGRGSEVSGWISGHGQALVSGLAGKASGFAAGIASRGGPLGKWFGGLLGGLVGKVESAGSAAVSMVSGAAGSATGFVANGVSSATGFLASKGSEVVGWLGNKASSTVSFVSNASSSAVDTVSQYSTQGLEFVNQQSGNALNWVNEKGNAALTTVRETGSSALNTLDEQGSAALGWVSDRAQQTVGWVQEQVDSRLAIIQDPIGALQEGMSAVGDAVSQGWTAAQETVGPLWESAKNGVMEAGQQFQSSVIEPTMNWAQEQYGQVKNYVQEKMPGLGHCLQKFEDLGTKALDYAKAKGQQALDWVKENYDTISTLGHLALDGLGMVPGFGAIADGANALWYLAEGNYTDAAMSALAAVPGIGDAAAAGKLGSKGIKLMDKVGDGTKLLNKAGDGMKGMLNTMDAGIKASDRFKDAMKGAEGIKQLGSKLPKMPGAGKGGNGLLSKVGGQAREMGSEIARDTAMEAAMIYAQEGEISPEAIRDAALSNAGGAVLGKGVETLANRRRGRGRRRNGNRGDGNQGSSPRRQPTEPTTRSTQAQSAPSTPERSIAPSSTTPKQTASGGTSPSSTLSSLGSQTRRPTAEPNVVPPSRQITPTESPTPNPSPSRAQRDVDVEPNSPATRDANVQKSSQEVDSPDLTDQQVSDELDFLRDNPKHFEGDAPNRTAKIGQHEWREKPNGAWCRHSDNPQCFLSGQNSSGKNRPAHRPNLPKDGISIEQRIKEGGHPPSHARKNPDKYYYNRTTGRYHRLEGNPGTPFIPTSGKASMSDAHSVGTIQKDTRFGGGDTKTIARRHIDTKADLREISEGKATLLKNGDIQTTSGRIYGKHPESDQVFLRTGSPGTVDLTRAEFRIFTKMIEEKGLKNGALKMLDKMLEKGNAGLSSHSKDKLLDLFEDQPLRSKDLRNYIDDVRESGTSRRGAASEMDLDGTTYRDYSKALDEDSLPQELKDALDSVPVDEREKWHGRCAEIGCLQSVLSDRLDPRGGIIRAGNIKNKKKGHGGPGTKKRPCSSCSHVLEYFGVHVEE